METTNICYYLEFPYITLEGGIYNMNIGICGLTAAGKTTHARLLAETLGYEYVSAAEIILILSGINLSSSKEMWFTHFNQLEEARKGDKIDDELEDQLKLLARSKTNIVFDTWALPWLSNEPMIRVWLKSDRLSRSWKCFMSQTIKKFSLIECVELIDKKDSTTRKRFARRHKFDLFRDHNRFDLILDNSHFITGPTDEAVKNGIINFRAYFETAIISLMRCDEEILSTFLIGRIPEARDVVCHSPFPRIQTMLVNNDIF